MKYTIETIEAEARAAQKEAELLEDARKLETKGFINSLSEQETTEAIKRLYLLHGKSDVGRWAFANIPGFAVNASAALRRTQEIIETQKSRNADVEALCERYAASRKAHRRTWLNDVDRHITALKERAERWEKVAQYLQDGQQERAEKGLPAVEINTIITAIKEAYAQDGSARRVAEWAAGQGYARNTSQAQKIVVWAIDETETDNEELENVCWNVRNRGRQIAYWSN